MTKLSVPTARPRFVSRERLLDTLSFPGDSGLALVCAPAGYGKTTLLTQWARYLQHHGTAVAWYAIDQGDNDPGLFGSYLCSSLLQALGPIPELEQAVHLLRFSPETDLRRILPLVINGMALSGKACILIIDDYHLITNPTIHSTVEYFLDHRPENLRIALGARSNPPLPLARLRARGQLIEIRTSGLRFREDETEQFLNQVMRLDLTPETVLALAGRSEGWIAGLQLAALSIQALPSPTEGEERSKAGNSATNLSFLGGGHQYLAEYLLEEVVDRLPEEVQWFLLATSLLERMSAPLCAAVINASISSTQAKVDPSQCKDILAQLEQANLFLISLDDQGEWFRYHHLFRDFLHGQLRRVMPENIPAFHYAASQWLEDHFLLHEAAAHAFQSRDWEFAAAFVERQSFTLITHSELATMHAWCAAFPEEVMLRHPELCILQTWAWVFTFRRDNRERVEKRLKQAEDVIVQMGNKKRESELNEHASVVRSFLAMAPDPEADPRSHLSLGKSMLRQYIGEEAGRFSAWLSIGYAQLALSDAPSAEKTLETARQFALNGGLFFGVIESSFHLARLAHSLGRLDHSAEICRQAKEDVISMLRAATPAQESAAWNNLPEPLYTTVEPDLPGLGSLDIALGCVLLEQDRLEEAENLLQRGLKRIGWGMNPFYLVTALTALFRLRVIQGSPVEGLPYLDRLEDAWPDIAFCTRGLRANLTLQASPDDPCVRKEAEDWCTEFAPMLNSLSSGMGPLAGAEVYYTARLTWMRTRVALGAADEVLPILHKQLELAESSGLVGRQIELLLVEGEACETAGDKDTAVEKVRRALTLAQPRGFVRIFDQGVVLTHLLRKVMSSGVFKEYIERILSAVTHREKYPLPPPPITRLPGLFSQAPVEILSQREQEILVLVARGASNQAIAEQLFITVGTVKSHVNHILGKLEARNRTEAVTRARELGFLRE